MKWPSFVVVPLAMLLVALSPSPARAGSGGSGDPAPPPTPAPTAHYAAVITSPLNPSYFWTTAANPYAAVSVNSTHSVYITGQPGQSTGLDVTRTLVTSHVSLGQTTSVVLTCNDQGTSPTVSWPLADLNGTYLGGAPAHYTGQAQTYGMFGDTSTANCDFYVIQEG